jgi:hypothetical protein
MIAASVDNVLVAQNGDGSGWTSYDMTSGGSLQQESDAGLDTACGITVVQRSDGADVVLSVDAAGSPAQGTIPASTKWTLVGTNAQSGGTVWQTPIGRTDPCSWGANNGPQNPLAETTTSTDGKAALFDSTAGDLLINLASGKFVNIGRPTSDRPVTDPNPFPPAEIIGTAAYVGNSVNPTSVGIYQASTGAKTSTSTNAALVTCISISCPLTKTASGVVFVADEGLGNSPTPTAVGENLDTGQTLWRKSLTSSSGTPSSTIPAGPVDINDYRLDFGHNLAAISPLTGHTVWSVNGANNDGSYCGYTSGRVYVLDNNQLAVLDAATGKQISFDASQTSCPQVISGAIIEQASSGYTVLPEPGNH